MLPVQLRRAEPVAMQKAPYVQQAQVEGLPIFNQIAKSQRAFVIKNHHMVRSSIPLYGPLPTNQPFHPVE